jgi:hypothetical protein
MYAFRCASRREAELRKAAIHPRVAGKYGHIEAAFALGTIDPGIRNRNARCGFANVWTSLFRIYCGTRDSRVSIHDVLERIGQAECIGW